MLWTKVKSRVWLQQRQRKLSKYFRMYYIASMKSKVINPSCVKRGQLFIIVRSVNQPVLGMADKYLDTTWWHYLHVSHKCRKHALLMFIMSMCCPFFYLERRLLSRCITSPTV